MRETICLDFDGVIHNGGDTLEPVMGYTYIPGKPVKGAQGAVRELRKKYKVVVCSSRAARARGRKAIAEWLRHWDIKVDGVVGHKPLAAMYVDDRGVQFNGSWGETLKAIRGYKHWRGA